MQLHFLSFLLNIASWIAFALLIGRGIRTLKNTTGSAGRFYTTILLAALIGGLLAQLANGSPEFGISLFNLFIASFAVVLAVFFAFPTYRRVLRKRIKHITAGALKSVRLGIAEMKSK